jgi:putative acetyltransferase
MQQSMMELSGKYKFILAETEVHFRVARELFTEYAGKLGLDLSFQNFDDELKNLDTMYAAPSGGVILLQDLQNETFIGCGAIRYLEPGTGELKRMYIRESYRGEGLGRQLALRCIELARQCQYSTIRLDTQGFMATAIKLYRDFGFKEIPAYRYNPNPDALYFELKLQD